MCATGRLAMEKMMPPSHSFRISQLHRILAAAGLSLLLALVPSGSASGQMPVTGTVTNAAGIPLRGVTVRVQGSEIRTLTGPNGKYSIAAPGDAVLNFTLI